ncbi:hypothetical protein EI555_017445 [Monodon monoceros]|uniref:PH domain-containing protein n=1 Tax=Monodon monoceros TaxID=40151 RepID=A0A4U1FQX2_MONMO|nr:hypothetical protein EI555_017445 [Monodon monoceros]
MVERMEAREQEMRRERTKGEELAVSELGREKEENLKGAAQGWLPRHKMQKSEANPGCIKVWPSKREKLVPRDMTRVLKAVEWPINEILTALSIFEAFVPNSSVWRGFAGEKTAFVKSGWLLRQSTILKRWKENWFDLWSDGHLTYYDDQTRQSVEDKMHMPVDCINVRMGRECQDIRPPDGKAKDCCRLFAETGKPSVFVQKAQMIVWPGNLHFRIPGQTQLMLAQKSCMMRLPWLPPHLLTQPMLHQPLMQMAMVHAVVHTCRELKFSMLRTGRLMLYPISTHMQDFMDSSLPTKSSFVSGIETMTVTWRWACWLQQPQAWL